MIRAKFTVYRHERTVSSEAVKVTLSAMYDDKCPEDQRYAKYTPSGTLEMLVDNPRAIEQLQLGRQFYLDFTPVDPAQS